ncbi:MAG: hydrogenase 3 maturation endopeptidase HyCI [bacterium]
MIRAFPVPRTFWTSSLLTAEVAELLRPNSLGTTLIITVGNDFRSDDGVGPYIAGKCPKLKAGYRLLNAKDQPENIIDQAIAARPAKVILIDGADFRGQPGEARIVKKAEIPQQTLSTHIFPLNIIAEMIEKEVGAPVWFLGVQAKNLEFGEKLSEEVAATAEEIIKYLNEGE